MSEQTTRVYAVIDTGKLQRLLHDHGIEVTLDDIAANSPAVMEGVKLIGIAGIASCQADGWAEHCRKGGG